MDIQTSTQPDTARQPGDLAHVAGRTRRLVAAGAAIVALLGLPVTAAVAGSPVAPAQASNAGGRPGPGPSRTAGAARSKAKAHKKTKVHKRRHPAKKHKKAPPVAPVAPPPVGGTPLVGTFKLNPGAYTAAGGVTGSYLRMILPGGTIARGPFFANLFSSSPDPTYTLIAPGTDGGLITGAYQPPPAPAFGGLLGDALADRIMQPQAFEVIKFSAATAPVDPQSGRPVPPPSIVDTGGLLTGDLAAVSAEWSSSYFNQGSPKPDGSDAGLTTPVAGYYDQGSRAFALAWSSTIVGGAFNGFTGYWHLEGVFEPAGQPG
jgi:hypothetical protein